MYYIDNIKASPRVAQTHATEGGPLTLGTHTIEGGLLALGTHHAIAGTTADPGALDVFLLFSCFSPFPFF